MELSILSERSGMQTRKRKKLNRWFITLGALVFLVFLLIAGFLLTTHVSPPSIKDRAPETWRVTHPDSGLSAIGNDRLRRNKYGLWELYVEGKPFERGVATGKLTKELLYKQEKAFVNQLREIVPSTVYRHFLKYFIYWFNRRLDHYIPEEFKEEIYGISLSASDEFSFIGSGYQRMLNYHSAHDIGHALQDMRLVGCSSFGAWNSMSADSSLIIGRNFDFYVGDDFAENKIICFEKPDSGYAFMMVTWGGMAGCVSGMNEQGLTVTMNASKSEIPFSARTPVSILAREILQYASDIREAYAIAGKMQTFVSESLLIGSANDHKAVIIEKAPFETGLVEPRKDYILCTNYFQSEKFRDDRLNKESMRDNASVYRYRRLLEDVTGERPLTPAKAAWILRDRKGAGGKDIGNGNEKAMNQLIAHHSIIFEPEKGLVWVSTNPWQAGSYICYNLTEIFTTFAGLEKNREIAQEELRIPADPFLETNEYKAFLDFRKMRREFAGILRMKDPVLPGKDFTSTFIASNPEFYEVYSLTGDYYFNRGEWEKAGRLYRQALSKVIPRWSEKAKIIRNLARCNIRLMENER